VSRCDEANKARRQVTKSRFGQAHLNSSNRNQVLPLYRFQKSAFCMCNGFANLCSPSLEDRLSYLLRSATLEPHRSVECYCLTYQLWQTMSSDPQFPKPSHHKPYDLTGIGSWCRHHFTGSHRSGGYHLENAKDMRQQHSGNIAQQDYDEQARSTVGSASQKVHPETLGLADIRESRQVPGRLLYGPLPPLTVLGVAA
jgi:hypothetical protein